MELHAKTEYTQKAHRTLTGITLFKRGNPTVAIILRSVLSLLILAAALFLPMDDMPLLDGLLTVCAIVLLLCMLLVISQYVFLPISQAKKQKKESLSPISYCFFDEHFTVDATANGAAEHCERRYDSLLQVIETEDYFFLFVSKTTAFILEKASLTGGTSADLREKLQPFSKKYIYRKI